MEQTSLTIPHERTWREVLAGEREQPYFVELLQFIEQQRRSGKIIYPANSDIFNALQYTPFERVRVVIIGQDPYHGPRQAHGLCFSVLPPTPPPPSLQNIFKELKQDLQIPPAPHGCLVSWARQGVLLLNTVLTVEAGRAGSHAGKGWERFTDRVIHELNHRHQGLVFLLWGSPAQRKAAAVDEQRHHILRAPHPSPLSASRGFFGCRHFSKANALLRSQGQQEIDWRLPSLEALPSLLAH